MHLAENTARISNLIYLSPFLSFIFINVILKESIRISSIAGLLLITAGILISRKAGTTGPGLTASLPFILLYTDCYNIIKYQKECVWKNN